MKNASEKAKTALALTVALAAGMGGSAVAGAKTETPKHALTRVINGLEHGRTALVSNRSIQIPRPVHTAKGQPIFFTAGGKAYEAYTQGHRPDFHQSPAELAGQMAIVNVSKAEINDLAEHHVEVVNAHLTAARVLVQNGTHGRPVGFSVGGGS